MNPPTAYYFDAPAPGFSRPATDPGQAPTRRTFRGIAYSGEVLAEWGGRFIIDLSSLRLPDPCPTLLQHDRDRPVGVCTLFLADQALACDGYLLSNEEALELAANADEGFPWQLSVHAQPGAVEEVAPGTAVSVNGRDLVGPLSILRQTLIRELSFTPTGVDANTHATVLSATARPPIQPDEAPAMSKPDEAPAPELAQLSAQVADLTAQLATATERATTAEAALAAHTRSARLSAVTATFATLGRTVGEADAAVYLALDESTWERVRADLLAAKPIAPAHLFSEQAVGEPGGAAVPSINLSAIYAARREAHQ